MSLLRALIGQSRFVIQISATSVSLEDNSALLQARLLSARLWSRLIYMQKSSFKKKKKRRRRKRKRRRKENRKIEVQRGTPFAFSSSMVIKIYLAIKFPIPHDRMFLSTQEVRDL